MRSPLRCSNSRHTDLPSIESYAGVIIIKPNLSIPYTRPWELVSDTTMSMSRVLQVHLGQFYVCWIKPTSNSCINSGLGYECWHSGIGAIKNPSHLAPMPRQKSQQRTSINNINMNHWHVFLILCRHASNWILLAERYLSNDSSFRLKHPGVLDSSDGSDWTSYPLTENQMRPVAQATGRVAYLTCGGHYTMRPILATGRVVYYACRSGFTLPSLCVRDVVTFTHHQIDSYVTLFTGVAVMQ